MKTWNTPAIEQLEIANTAFDALQGTVVDGQYQDHNDCMFKDAFYAS